MPGTKPTVFFREFFSGILCLFYLDLSIIVS